MADDIDPINQRVSELLSYGVPEQDIVSHLAQSKDQQARLWVQKWKAAQTSQRAEERVGTPQASDQTSEQSMLSKAQKWASENPITTAAIATAATAAAGAGAYALKERIKTNAEIRKERELAKFEPTEAVKIQREQLELSKQKFQAEQDALIKSETANAINTQKSNTLNTYAEQKYGAPLAKLEEISGGKLKSIADVDIVGGTLSKGGGITVNNAGAFTQPSGYSQVPASKAVVPTIDPLSIPPSERWGAPISPTPDAPSAVTTSDPLAPRPNSYMTPSVEAGVEAGNASKAIQTVVAKEIDKTSRMYRNAEGKMVYPEGMSPAARSGYEAFTKQYPDIAKTLETKGQFGILGAGSGDNNLFNSYESDLMKRLRNEVNQGQMVGPYTNYEKKVNPAIKAIPPESTLGKELGELRANQIGGKYGELGTPAAIGGKKGGLIVGPNTVPKAIKAGAPALLLMSMADAAKAATKGNMAPSKELGFDLATGAALAKLLGGPAAAAGAMALGSSGLNPNEEKELAYLRKVGTGRGIAPPSAYKR